MSKQKGFSIVELMISITLGLIIIGAVTFIFLTSSKTNRTQDNIGRLQENARLALNKMQFDIRMAGYRGCLGRKGQSAADPTTAVVNNITTISYDNNLDAPLQGFEASSTSWSPALDSSISSATPAPAAGSDVITIRTATGTGAPLTAVMANGTAAIPIASNVDGLQVGSTALIADCVGSTVFKVTGITSSSISHATGSNSSADLTRAYNVDATVMPVSTITYYVGPSNDLAGGFSLWRKTNTAASEELADNVEQLQLLYGEDTDGDLVPDNYVTANNVAIMRNVMAVKLMLLMRTSDDRLSVSGQTYTFNGVSGVTPSDKRLRRVFNSVVAIRNRTN